MTLVDLLVRSKEKAAEESLRKSLAAAYDAAAEGSAEEREAYAEKVSGLSADELFGFAGYNEAESERIGYSNYSYWGSTLRMFFKNKGAVFILTVMLMIILFTIIQPHLPNQFDPYEVNFDERYITARNVSPNGTYWFGTNSIGQDLWARIWAGTRTSLIIGFSVALIDAVVGIVMGVLWGYVRRLDFLFTEIYNVLDNIPQTIILILISYMMSPSVKTLIFACSVTSWIGMARFIRNQILIIRDRDYNLASRCLGTPTRRLIFRNLLPYLVSVIMLRIALSIPSAIGNEVFVTYIGLGLPVTVSSLGSLINEGRKVMTVAALRYQLFFPTIILSIVTISFYIIGNAFSDAADPKNHR